MKSQYLYFGSKGYYQQTGVAPGSGTADLTATSIANSGFMIKDISYGGGDAAGIEVVYRVYQAASASRGSSYTAAIGQIGIAGGPVDMFQKQTSAGLDTSDATLPYATPVNHVQHEVTRLLDEAWQSSSQVITIKDDSGSGSTTIGATLHANDSVWVNETKLLTAGRHTPFQVVGQDLCVPAKNFLGATPVTADVGNGAAGGHSSHDGGMHWNGDSIDITELHFKSGDSSIAIDTVLLKHTAGKFKEVCEVMQHLYNGNNYDEIITVHELDPNGQNVHQAFGAKGITIYGCHITSVARA